MQNLILTRKFFLLASLVCLTISFSAQAEDRMYFTGLVEQNSNTLNNQVLLVWGPMEREIPLEIEAFRLYRRPIPGSYTFLSQLTRGVADVPTISAFFSEPGEELRLQNILEWAYNDSGGVVDASDVFTYVHTVLSTPPADPNYNPLTQLFLARMNFDIARSLGQGYIDRAVLPAVQYEYMLTGVVGGVETKPLGKTTLTPSTPTLLSAPSGFAQVFVGGCSAISKGIDDRRIHFRWDVPNDPNSLQTRILTYGYDLYRSDSNLGLGPNDLRNMQATGMFHPGLTKINNAPIIVAGAAPTTGRDSFLAIDEGNLETFQFLQRGRTYWYYLVKVDLSGRYSRMAPAIEAQVPDSMPPPAPWNVRTEEIKDPGSPTTPRIQLVWDEINKSNYIKHYGARRTYVTPPPFASVNELYYLPATLPNLPQNIRDVDLGVTRYRLFRFDTQEKAQGWGTDSDLDLWPDEIENSLSTDPCDETDHPAGSPPEFVIEIPLSDATTLRTLSNGTKQRFFMDTAPVPDNKVHWYRLIAIDEFDNQSPLTPPIRGVLYDRTQPEPDASVTKEECIYSLIPLPPQECENESGVRFHFRDDTRNELGFVVRIFEVCRQVDQRDPRLVHAIETKFVRREARILLKNLSQQVCQTLCGPNLDDNKYIFRVYDTAGNLVATYGPVTLDLCRTERTDCFILKEQCRRVPVGPGESLDPDNPIIQVCVELKPGERARIFHELNGKMTPFRTIHAATDAPPLQDYCEDIDLTAIVPTGACLGVRVFSKNNVGSYIKYLNCVTIPSSTPEAPLFHSVDPTGTAASPTFTLRWSAQSDGISAFVLTQKKGSSIQYHTFWVNDPALEYKDGLYTAVLNLNPASDLGVEWCFRVKAIDNTLRSSDWSSSRCETWEPEPKEHLTWPPVSETETGSGIIAFFHGTPVNPQNLLVLSDDLTGKLTPDGRCQFAIPDCREQTQRECLQPIEFNCTGICDALRAAQKYGKFIVYRQEQGKDFVQVSPLIDTFWCYRQDEKPVGGGLLSKETLDDPFIYLVNPLSGFVKPPALFPEVSGLRLVFADHYPMRSGSKVRYQVMVVDPITGEGVAMHYSNWLDIP